MNIIALLNDQFFACMADILRSFIHEIQNMSEQTRLNGEIEMKQKS